LTTKPTTIERLRIIQMEKIRIRRCMADDMRAIREKYADVLSAIKNRELYLQSEWDKERNRDA
jgi:phage host-nuclease inhibitor protein Gam